MLSSQKYNSVKWRDVLFLVLIFGSLYWWYLGSRPLFVPDEGRYAEIAREMLSSHDYITPHLNDIKYFEKPVLFYWLSAFAIKLGGLSLWSIRSVNAALALIGVIATYLCITTLYDRKCGLACSTLLGTCALYVIMAHMITLDLPVTVFLLGSLYAYLLHVRLPTRRYLFLYLSVICAALAVLTKGLIGIVFPLLIVSLWIALTRQWYLLKYLFSPSAIALFLLLVAPWHWLVGSRNPEFFYYYFIEQHFLRYTDKNIGHYQPIWYFIPIFILGFFPWIFFLPQTLLRILKTTTRNPTLGQANAWFFLLWGSIIFLFFSFSKSKLIPYILPSIPPFAILVGLYLSQLKMDRRLYAIASCMGFVFIIFFAKAPSLDTRTIEPLAQIINQLGSHQDDVITYNQYFQDLPYYLQRRVSILNWKNELEFGMQHQIAHDWMLNDAAFWQRLHGKHRVFVLISDSEWQQFTTRYPFENMCVLGKINHTVLFTNDVKLNCSKKGPLLP